MDLGSSARDGARAAMYGYRRRRVVRHEPASFTRAWASIDSVDGWLPKREGELLFHLASLVASNEAIVEIGSYCGRSTSALALGTGCRANAVYAVDPHTGCKSQVEAGLIVDTFATFIGNLQRLGLTKP